VSQLLQVLDFSNRIRLQSVVEVLVDFDLFYGKLLCRVAARAAEEDVGVSSLAELLVYDGSWRLDLGALDGATAKLKKTTTYPEHIAASLPR